MSTSTPASYAHASVVTLYSVLPITAGRYQPSAAAAPAKVTAAAAAKITCFIFYSFLFKKMRGPI